MAKRFSVEAVFKGLDKISKPVRSMGRSVSNFVKHSNRQIASLGARFKSLGSLMAKGIKVGAVTAAGGIAALGASAFSLVKQFSVLENAEAAFTPLLKSSTKATELVDKLNQTAASTPFQFENLAGAANQLLPVMKGNIQDTIKTLRMLGDTAGGNAQKLETITRGYTKAMLKGKVDLESLNMIAEAGVPIFDDLAKVMGMDVGTKFFKRISAGKVKTDQLTKAFENMTSKGGIFFKGMEIASKTTTGVISTMKDNISLAAASLGKILAPIVKEYANKITEVAKVIKSWVQQNEGLIKQNIESFIKGLISAIKTIISIIKQLIPYFIKMAEFGKIAFEWIKWASPFLKPFIATILILVGVITAWSTAMAIVNAVMAVNPISLIIIGVSALVAGIVLLIQNWDAVVAAIKKGVESIWNWFSSLLDNPFIAAIGTIFAPFITIPALIIKHWEPLKEFFNSIGDKIKSIPFIGGAMKFLGIGYENGNNQPKPVTPQERLSTSIERSENNSTLTIHDKTGRAELSKQKRGGTKIQLATSGGA